MKETSHVTKSGEVLHSRDIAKVTSRIEKRPFPKEQMWAGGSFPAETEHDVLEIRMKDGRVLTFEGSERWDLKNTFDI